MNVALIIIINTTTNTGVVIAQSIHRISLLFYFALVFCCCEIFARIRNIGLLASANVRSRRLRMMLIRLMRIRLSDRRIHYYSIMYYELL
jgi:hypothetical protein